MYDEPDDPDDFYDVTGLLYSNFTPRFLLGRVSKTWNDEVTTWYSYDDQGNIEWMVQHFNDMGSGIDGTKTIHYEYDFLGNVLEVIYHDGQYRESDKEEQFDHIYSYDADGRLESVETQEYDSYGDPVGEEPVQQAKYEYYLHGPLKRTELGGDLQGIDYVYNINGWLKSINNPALNGTADGYSLDPGGDGSGSSEFQPDVFGMTIDYYNKDYERTGGWSTNGYIDIQDAARGTYINYGDPETPDLFNGNIKSVRWQIKDQELDGSPELPLSNTHWAYAYDYNEKNWLKEAEFGVFKPDYTINQGWILNEVEADRASEAIAEKAENNAPLKEITQTALEAIESDPDFDSQNNNFYNIYGPYETVPDNTIADFVENDIPEFYNVNKGIASALAEFNLIPWLPEVEPLFNPDDDDAYHVWDIDYDLNGNIETFKRNAYKVGSLVDMDKLTYNYDSDIRNRLLSIDDEVSPSAFNDIDDQGDNNYTYNDIGQMTGNVLDGHYFKYDVYGMVTGVYSDGACTTPIVLYKYDDKGYRVYKDDGSTETWYVRDAAGNLMSLYEKPSGESISQTELPIYGASRIGTCRPGETSTYEYELTDHLGNVRVTFKEDGDEVEMLSQTDYYPGGFIMPGREYVAGEGQYRFAFQGQWAELDQETGYNSFELRLYDNRICRWMVPDPYGQYYSPYMAMGNNPIVMIDPNGGWAGDPPIYTLPEVTVIGKTTLWDILKNDFLSNPQVLTFLAVDAWINSSTYTYNQPGGIHFYNEVMAAGNNEMAKAGPYFDVRMVKSDMLLAAMSGGGAGKYPGRTDLSIANAVKSGGELVQEVTGPATKPVLQNNTNAPQTTTQKLSSQVHKTDPAEGVKAWSAVEGHYDPVTGDGVYEAWYGEGQPTKLFYRDFPDKPYGEIINTPYGIH